MKEKILEPILRVLCIRKVLPTIRQHLDCRFLDGGYGWDYLLLKTVEPFIKSGIIINFKVQESQINKIKTIRMKMDEKHTSSKK